MRTIEVAEKSYELSPLWERWFGQFLDRVISCFIILVGVALSVYTGLAEIGVVIAIILSLFSYLFEDGLSNGQSYGKRTAKIKVIDSRDGSPCTFGQSFVRNLFGLLGFIDWVFIFGEKRQRLGDKAARTLVIKAMNASALADSSDNGQERSF